MAITNCKLDYVTVFVGQSISQAHAEPLQTKSRVRNRFFPPFSLSAPPPPFSYPLLSPPFSLSLSHARTHARSHARTHASTHASTSIARTHTHHTHTYRFACKFKLSLSLSLSLSRSLSLPPLSLPPLPPPSLPPSFPLPLSHIHTLSHRCPASCVSPCGHNPTTTKVISPEKSTPFVGFIKLNRCVFKTFRRSFQPESLFHL
jgi:hypothetical protein